jgi:hypothetical protein
LSSRNEPVFNVLVLYGTSGIIIQFTPGIDVSRMAATLIAGIFSGVIFYIEFS